MTTFTDKYRALGNPDPSGMSLYERLVEVTLLPGSADAAMRLNAQVVPQGRYTERVAAKPRALGKFAAAATPVLAAGEDVFLRPSGEQYHARTWGEHQDVMVLRKAREATSKAFLAGKGSSMFTLIYGEPGCGKTALIEAAFGEGGMYTLMGTGDTEVADMTGGYIQTPSGRFDWQDGDLVKAAIEGKPYFIDEIGLIDPKALSVLYGLMDGRREITINANPARGTIKAHPDFYVVAATNPNAPGVRLSEALLSRFTNQVEMTTDWGLARKLGVPTTVVTAAQNLNKKRDSQECMWAPQMRELLAFRDISETFGLKFAISNLLAAAPEIDRPIVADVLTRVFGDECKPAKI